MAPWTHGLPYIFWIDGRGHFDLGNLVELVPFMRDKYSGVHRLSGLIRQIEGYYVMSLDPS